MSDFKGSFDAAASRLKNDVREIVDTHTQRIQQHMADVFAPVRATADISECGRFRYSLTREWNVKLGRCLFVMLNPSTADALQDDPTIRKCMGFARRWGFGSIEVVNLWAWRATDPKALNIAIGEYKETVIGQWNDAAIDQAGDRATLIVAAWGANKASNRGDRAENVLNLLDGYRIFCIRRTEKTRAPEHPLYLPYELEPETYAEPYDDPNAG